MTRAQRVAVAIVVAAFAGAVLRTIAVEASFEYDEAVYATQSRAWSTGAPASGVEPHRAPLLPVLAMPIASTADGEAAFRVVGLAWSIVALVLVAAVARSLAGGAAAVAATAIVAASHHMVHRSAQFMTDIPALAFLLSTVLVLWQALERGYIRRLPLVAPLVAGAFYARYASIVPIVGILAVAGVAWRGKLRRHAKIAVATALLTALAIAPHLVQSTMQTGTPWGAVAYTERISRYAERFEGLATYVLWFPAALAGVAGGLAALAAVGAAVTTAVRREGGPTARARMLLVAPAVLHIVALGITTHAEARFVFFPMAALAIAGADVGYRAIASLRRPGSRRAAGAVLAVAWSAAFLWGAREAVLRTTEGAERREVVRATGLSIRPVAVPGCRVVTTQVPVVTWYSGCGSYELERTSPSAIRPEPDLLVVFDRIPFEPENVARWRSLADPTPILVIPGSGEPFGAAEIYRLRRPLH